MNTVDAKFSEYIILTQKSGPNYISIWFLCGEIDGPRRELYDRLKDAQQVIGSSLWDPVGDPSCIQKLDTLKFDLENLRKLCEEFVTKEILQTYDVFCS